MFKQLMRKARSNRKGFTLVELMVVVVMIGILVAIAIPQFGNVTRNAERSAVEANLRTIDGAILMYQAGEGVFPNIAIPLYQGPSATMQAWPTGPAEAQYGLYTVNNQRRAVVWGEAGGVNLGTVAGTYTLENLPWD